MHPQPSPFPGLLRLVRAATAVAAGGCGLAFGETSLVGRSPFSPGTLAGAGSVADESYELAGSTAQGAEVTVCIYAKQTKHSQWIPVGGEVNGIHVVSYDASHDSAVVMVAGARKELSLRKAVVAAADPSQANRYTPPGMAVPEPAQQVVVAAPSVPGNAAQEQREARMLVSDLLEIGVQQRKAYAEAKERAASGTPPPPAN